MTRPGALGRAWFAKLHSSTPLDSGRATHTRTSTKLVGKFDAEPRCMEPLQWLLRRVFGGTILPARFSVALAFLGVVECCRITTSWKTQHSTVQES